MNWEGATNMQTIAESFAHLKIGLFAFLLLSCKCSFYVLDTRPLIDIWFTNIFSQRVVFSFFWYILWNKSFQFWEIIFYLFFFNLFFFTLSFKVMSELYFLLCRDFTGLPKEARTFSCLSFPSLYSTWHLVDTI